jgi:glycosyltransferase involved in cell wall biosynthesis
MTENPILSICIPTYNRLSYLKNLLELLLPQILSKKIEICISDNNSSDGTRDFLRTLINDYTFIKCQIQSNNLAIDDNMYAVIAMATGQYIYPIGDDDVILEGGLNFLIAEATRGGDLVVLNGWHTDASLKNIREHIPPPIAGSIFVRPDLAFIELWDKLPFGSFMASRDCFLESNFKRYLGTSHAYGGVVWDMLAIKYEKGNCVVRCIAQPVVLLRGADKTWKKNEAQILFVDIPCWFNLIECYGIYKMPLEVIRFNYISKITSPYFLVYLRASGQINPDNLTKYAECCSTQQKIAMYLISSLPIEIARGIIKIRNFLRVADSVMNYIAK